VYEKEAKDPTPKKKPKARQRRKIPCTHIRKRGIGAARAALDKKMTSPPKDYTEATLLRAMETAGKQIDDEELKEALKENGIGRLPRGQL
jgi:DNA topoisomerase-3